MRAERDRWYAMHSRRLVLRVGLWCAALALLGGPTRADTVILKDGRILTGRVVERGDRIFIERQYGGTTIPRSEVVRIESDTGEEKLPEQPKLDVVILKDGRIVRGDVAVSSDGREVIVRLDERGEVRHPRTAVSIIHWRDGRQDAPGLAPGDAGSDLQRTVDRLVSEMGSQNAGVAADARRELLALGPFARGYLDALAVKHPERLKPLLEQLDRLSSLRRMLPPKAEESVPRLAERLVSTDPQQREAALRAVSMEAPGGVGPLLLEVVKTDQDERVKAYCVSQLASLRCFEQLGEVLKLTEGPLRLAAALALGDAGVYAGVPIVIEALRIQGKGASDRPAQEIREVANTKLCEWTGQQFGFRAAAPAEEREVAIRRWEAWWSENGDELLRRTLREAAPELVGAKVTDKEAQDAQKRWDEATKLMTGAAALEVPGREEEALEDPVARQRAAAERLSRRRQLLEQAADELAGALALDPRLSTARMTRAALLYEELGRPRDAERELDVILARAEHDPGDPDAARKFAHIHQARIALREGAFQRAAVRFTQAINFDERCSEAWEGQGDAQMALAMQEGDGDGTVDRDVRREALAAARAAYQGAIRSVLQHEEDLKRIIRDLMAEAPESVSEGQVLQSVRRSNRNLEQSRARLQAKLGRAFAAMGEDRKALEAFQAALALDGENKDYQEAVATWGRLLGPGEERPAPPPGPPSQGPPSEGPGVPR